MLTYTFAKICSMNRNSRKMTREQHRAFDIWTAVTLLTVVGAYLGTWLLLIILDTVLT